MAKDFLRIGFRSGTEVSVECDGLTIEKNTVENRVTAISWTGGPGLLFMALDQIDYVIEER